MRNFWLQRSLIQGVHLTLCTNEQQFNNEMRRAKVANPDPWLEPHWNACVHHLQCGQKFMCIVCIPLSSDRTGIEIASLLAHEAVHVWQRTKDHIGESNPSREFEAYAIENILFQLLTEYHRQATKGKK